MWVMPETIPGETGNWRQFFATKSEITQATTLSEMAEDLRHVATYLEEMRDAGVSIVDPEGDGLYTFQTMDVVVAERFGFDWEPFEVDEPEPITESVN
jgi:hypothetical protein